MGSRRITEDGKKLLGMTKCHQRKLTPQEEADYHKSEKIFKKEKITESISSIK